MYTYRKCSPVEEVDSSEDSTDLGEEWPTFEDEEVARQREFNQVNIDVVWHLKIFNYTYYFVVSVGVVLYKEITLLRWKYPLRSVQCTYTYTI